MNATTRALLLLATNVPVARLLLAVAPRNWAVVRVGGVRVAIFASKIGASR